MATGEQDYIDYLINLTSNYYNIIKFLSGIFPVMLIIGLLMINHWLKFDPLTPFEKRRLKMARRLKNLLTPVDPSEGPNTNSEIARPTGEIEL